MSEQKRTNKANSKSINVFWDKMNLNIKMTIPEAEWSSDEQRQKITTMLTEQSMTFLYTVKLIF